MCVCVLVSEWRSNKEESGWKRVVKLSDISRYKADKKLNSEKQFGSPSQEISLLPDSIDCEIFTNYASSHFHKTHHKTALQNIKKGIFEFI